MSYGFQNSNNERQNYQQKNLRMLEIINGEERAVNRNRYWLDVKVAIINLFTDLNLKDSNSIFSNCHRKHSLIVYRMNT